MKTYIAGSYRRKTEALEIATRLIEKGHDITSTWLLEKYDANIDIRTLTPERLSELAQLDLADVDRSDALVFMAELPYAQPPRGSRHVEFGYALSRGCKVFVIGSEPENIFHYLPGVTVVASVEDIP